MFNCNLHDSHLQNLKLKILPTYSLKLKTMLYSFEKVIAEKCVLELYYLSYKSMHENYMHRQFSSIKLKIDRLVF